MADDRRSRSPRCSAGTGTTDRPGRSRPTSATAATRGCGPRSRMAPADVITAVKDSGLRGRGGAGFPTGLKWSFLPKPRRRPALPRRQRRRVRAGHLQGHPDHAGQPAGADRGRDHHQLRDRLQHGLHLRARRGPARRTAGCSTAVEEARAAGYLGKNILGSGFDLEIVVHAGAGAYICGEETALLDSLEGRRGQPRLKPPFPAVAGLYARPTVVNNVESIASVPSIVAQRRRVVRVDGHARSRPASACSRCPATSTEPGQYEAPLGITLRELLDMAGGVRAGHRLKFWTPGGSSTPLFTDEHLDTPLDFESRRRRRLDARHPGAADLRRDDLRRARRAALDRVLQARVLRQVHAVPRGHVLAGADPAPARGRRRAPRRTSTSCSTSATTSSAARSAPSATARPARSRRRCSTSGTSTSATSTSGGCPFDPVASTVFAGATPDDCHDATPDRRRSRRGRTSSPRPSTTSR